MYIITREKKIGDMYMYMYTKIKKDNFAADCLIDQVIIRTKYSVPVLVSICILYPVSRLHFIPDMHFMPVSAICSLNFITSKIGCDSNLI